VFLFQLFFEGFSPNFSCLPLAEWHMNNLGVFIFLKKSSVFETLVPADVNMISINPCAM